MDKGCAAIAICDGYNGSEVAEGEKNGGRILKIHVFYPILCFLFFGVFLDVAVCLVDAHLACTGEIGEGFFFLICLYIGYGAVIV